MVIAIIRHDDSRMGVVRPFLCEAITLLLKLSWAHPVFGIDAEDLSVGPRQFAGYQLFIALKCAFKDFHCTLFSPGKKIDLVWHRHLLWDTERYSMFTRDMCGFFINHRQVSSEHQLARMRNNFKRAKTGMLRIMHTLPIYDPLSDDLLAVRASFPLLHPPLAGAYAEPMELAEEDEADGNCG